MLLSPTASSNRASPRTVEWPMDEYHRTVSLPTQEDWAPCGLIFLWCVTSEGPVVGQEKKILGRHGTQEAPLWESCCVLEYVGARAHTLDYTSGVKAAQLPALDQHWCLPLSITWSIYILFSQPAAQLHREILAYLILENLKKHIKFNVVEGYKHEL